MGSPLVTFPGTSGNYVSSADVNLLDANSAHTHQSYGSVWVRFAAEINYPLVRSTDVPMFGDASVKAVSNQPISGAIFLSRKTTGFVVIAGSTQYSVSVVIQHDAAGTRNFRMGALTADVGNALVNLFQSSSFAVPPNTPTEISVTFTGGASEVGVLPSISLRGDETAASTAENYYWGKACIRQGADATFVPSLRIVGDLDLRARAAATDWTTAGNQTILHNAASNNGYSLQITTGGELLAWHGDGTDYNPGTSTGAALPT